MRKCALFATHALPFAGYVVLTVLVTWPVLPRFLTHIPGGGDAFWFLWQLWWFKHALLDLRQSPFVTDLIYYPITDVPVTSQTPFNEFFTLPLQVAIGVVPLYNLLFFLSYALSGYFTYLLGLAIVRRRDIAFVGGVIFAFCAYRGMRGLGHLSLLTTQWMPLALLLAIQWWRRPSLSRGVAVGIGGALVALSSPYYSGFFLLPVLLVAVVYLLIWQRQALWRFSLWQTGAVATAVFLLLTIPFYWPLLLADAEIHQVNQGLAQFATEYSADLLSWVLPSGLHPLWGRYTAAIYQHFTTANLMETTLFVGFLPLILSVLSLGLRRSPKAIHFWQLLALVSGLLALGPDLHINGARISGGLPFQWLLALPGFDAFRIPSRAGITTALAISVLTMLTLHQVGQRFTRRRWSLALALVTAFTLVEITPFYPYPTADTTIPPVYTDIAQTSDRKALLELPAGEYFHLGRNFFGEVSWYMYYQSYHQKPIVSGYLGRRPKRLSYPEQHLPFVQRFFQDKAGRDMIDTPPLALVPEPFWPDEILRGQELLASQGIGHVLIHCAFLRPDQCTTANTLLKQSWWLPTAADETLAYYRVKPSAYQSVAAPTYLTNPPLFFDAAFGPPQIDAQGRIRSIRQSGQITFTLALEGVWQIQGELVGTEAEALRFRLDDRDIAPQLMHTPTGLGFRLEGAMTPGNHSLYLAASSATYEPTHTDDPGCHVLCMRNLHIQLKKPTVAPDTRPVATFVNETGQQFALLQTTVFSTQEVGAAAAQPSFLLNVWRLDQQSYKLLRSAPSQMPANYIHLTNAAGDTLAQADHQLGQRMLFLSEEPLLFDLVALPATLPAGPAAQEQAVADLSVLSTLELRMGLWYPTTQQYFWSPETTAIDTVGRVQVGNLAQLNKILPLPSLQRNPALMTTFVNAADGRTLRLLAAQILAAAGDPQRLQLATIWETPDLFLPEVSVTLALHITNDAGEIVQGADHLLSTDQLIWHNGAIRYDVVDLPQALPIEANHEVRIGLGYADSTERYQADRADLLDRDGRVRLGAIADLQQQK